MLLAYYCLINAFIMHYTIDLYTKCIILFRAQKSGELHQVELLLFWLCSYDYKRGIYNFSWNYFCGFDVRKTDMSESKDGERALHSQECCGLCVLCVRRRRGPGTGWPFWCSLSCQRRTHLWTDEMSHRDVNKNTDELKQPHTGSRSDRFVNILIVCNIVYILY